MLFDFYTKPFVRKLKKQIDTIKSTEKDFRNEKYFIYSRGNGGYEVDKKLVASLTNALGTSYEINYPEIQSKETEPDYGWTKQIDKKISDSENNLILIGHSFGASNYI